MGLKEKVYYDSQKNLNFWVDYIVSPNFAGNIWFQLLTRNTIKHLGPHLLRSQAKILGMEKKKVIGLINDTTGLNSDSYSLLAIKSWRKILLFVFHEKNIHPSIVYKMSYVKACVKELQQEEEILNELSKFNVIVPKPYGSGIINDMSWFSQSVLKGEPLITILFKNRKDERKIKEIILSGKNYIESYQAITEGCYITASQMLRDIPPRFNQTILNHIKKMLSKEVDKHKITKIPTVIQHTDFHPANMLFVDKHVVAIDWENAQKKGLPLVDLFNFIMLTYCFTTRKSISGWNFDILSGFKGVPLWRLIDIELFKMLFYDKNQISDNIIDVIRKHCAVMNIPYSLTNLLFYMFVLKYMYRKELEPLVAFVFNNNRRTLFA